MSLKGSQSPTVLVAPSPKGWNEDEGEDALFYAEQHDYSADEWQATVVRTWMRARPDGKWAASIWGLTVPRQNGKNGSLEIVELYMLAVLGLKIVHTAHEVKTARKAFRRLQNFFGKVKNDPDAKFPALNARVVAIRNVNGQESIELDNGGLIEFVARSKGSGRGFTSDVLILDEAQHLTDEQLEALKPAISAAPSGAPVTIYLGTPPKDLSEEGEPFVRTRVTALQGGSRATWIEFSAPGDVDDMTEAELEKFVRNRANWATSNPALGIRILEETVEGELVDMSARSFARERFNMWPTSTSGARKAIHAKSWDDVENKEPSPDWPLASIGLDMNPERTKVTITMCVWAEGDARHLEVAADAPFSDAGTTALVDWVWERAKRRHPVVIDSMSPARSLEPHLKKRGCSVFVLGSAEYSQACMGLHDAVKEKSAGHSGQVQLTASVTGATKEAVGKAGAWKFGRVSLETDLGPAVSAACAWFGSIKFARRPRADSEKKKRHALVG